MKEDKRHDAYTIAAVLSGGRPRFISGPVIMSIGRAMGIPGKKVRGVEGRMYTPEEAGEIYEEFKRRGRAKHQHSIDAFYARKAKKDGRN